MSAVPISVSCSQTHSSMEKSRRDFEQCSSFGQPFSKGPRNRDLGSVCRIPEGKGRDSVRTKKYSLLP